MSAAGGDAGSAAPGMPEERSAGRATMGWHRAEYFYEGLGLGLFMISACVFGTLLEHPASPVRQALSDATVRRGLMGLAMGLTAYLLIHSPWGKRSGAHMNPAVTLAFWRLGHVRGRDLAGYTAGQFVGGMAGVFVAAAALGPAVADSHVHFVVTKPGAWGIAAAFAAEFAMALILLSVVLRVSTRPRLMPWTGAVAGGLIATFILLIAPISGTSLNPARTFASGFAARDWTGWWIYFVAPPIAMLAAAELYCFELRQRGEADTGCAKLDHDPRVRCIFCGHDPARRTPLENEPAHVAGTSAGPASLRSGSRSS